jgi:glutathione S-transferase
MRSQSLYSISTHAVSFRSGASALLIILTDNLPHKALKIGTNGDCLGESTVIMEYLEELFCPPNVPAMDEQRYPTTLPSLTDPYARAKARLAIDHVNRNIVPAFYRYLQAQEEEKQVKGAKEYVDALAGLVDSMDKEGPFWGGNELGMVDMTVLPWILRGRTVLRSSSYRLIGRIILTSTRHYRSFAIPFSPDSRYKKWEDAVCSHPAVKATTSEDGLYLDSYERWAGAYNERMMFCELSDVPRYAKNLPNTSKVADAINSGRGLP